LSGAGIGIFGLYVAYDTNNILKRADYYQGDFITASMDYYLDIINLVSNMMHVNE
jgi:FtsH-binding integral membrane protein